MSAKKNKRTVSVVNKPSASTLRTLGEAHMSALIVLSQVDGVPEDALPYHKAAMSLLASTMDDIQNRYLALTKSPMNLSYVEKSFAMKEPEECQSLSQSLTLPQQAQ